MSNIHATRIEAAAVTERLAGEHLRELIVEALDEGTLTPEQIAVAGGMSLATVYRTRMRSRHEAASLGIPTSDAERTAWLDAADD